MLYTCTILTFSSFCQYFHQSAEAKNDDTRGFLITYGEYMRTCSYGEIMHIDGTSDLHCYFVGILRRIIGFK